MLSWSTFSESCETTALSFSIGSLFGGDDGLVVPRVEMVGVLTSMILSAMRAKASVDVISEADRIIRTLFGSR